MDTAAYLDRIGYTGERTPSLAVLRALQQAHLFTVPFENLDIHRGVRITLDGAVDKIVRQRRGGFCYELNGAFFRLLGALGFTVRLISGRVYDDTKGYGPEFDHMTILVLFEKEAYLADVGFGEFTLHPLPLMLNADLADPYGVFRIEAGTADELVVLKKSGESSWRPQYVFTMTARQATDFKEMCLYHQTSPDSHFTQKRICSLPVPGGRITLTGDMLRIRTGKEVVQQAVISEAELEAVLASHFGIRF
jgi:N-hydroxyarylamine O-acetyltransferase